MDKASEKGHVHVLEWWKKSGLELKWSERSLENVRKNVLNWWKASGLQLKIFETTRKNRFLELNGPE